MKKLYRKRTLFLAIVLLLCCTACQLFYLYRRKKYYQPQLEQANIQCTICRNLNAAPPDPTSGGMITCDVLRDAQLIPIPDGEHAALLCQGLYANLDRIGRLDL